MFSLNVFSEQKHSVIRVIPSGEVMQYARGYIDQSGHKIFQTQFNKADISTDLDILNTSDIDIIKNRVKLNRDGFHASMLGRYMLALVWFRMLFGITVTGNRFMPGNEENVLSMGYDKTGAVKNIHMSFEKIPENYFCLVQKIVDEYFSKESSLIDYK